MPSSPGLAEVVKRVNAWDIVGRRLPSTRFQHIGTHVGSQHRAAKCCSHACRETHLYDLVGIPVDATRIEVEQAHAKFFNRYKKPRNRRKISRKECQAIILALEVLSSRSLRSVYDLGGLDALSGRHAALKDLLDVATGNVKCLVRLDLEEAAHGVQKSVKMNVSAACDACDGQGIVESGSQSCDACGGDGLVLTSSYNPNGSRKSEDLQSGMCPSCGGTGEQWCQFCKVCKGEGLRKVERVVKLDIPPGVRDGAMIVAKGHGEVPSLGAHKGDLYVGILIRKHDEFSTIGQDVYSTVGVPLFLAMLGGQMEASTVWGVTTLSIPLGTQHGDKIVLAQAGLPCEGLEQSRGSHFYTVKILVPHRNVFEDQDLLHELHVLSLK